MIVTWKPTLTKTMISQSCVKVKCIVNSAICIGYMHMEMQFFSDPCVTCVNKQVFLLKCKIHINESNISLLKDVVKIVWTAMNHQCSQSAI